MVIGLVLHHLPRHHAEPPLPSSSVCTPPCCSTTRNFLTRYFQTSPNKALITREKGPALIWHLVVEVGEAALVFLTLIQPGKLLVKLTPASSPSGHTARMRNSHNFPPLTPMTPCCLRLCRQIKQVMPTFQAGRWVTLSSPSPPVQS